MASRAQSDGDLCRVSYGIKYTARHTIESQDKTVFFLIKLWVTLNHIPLVKFVYCKLTPYFSVLRDQVSFVLFIHWLAEFREKIITFCVCYKIITLLCAHYTNLSHLTTNLFYMCYFVYYLCVMMCVCRILIKITYLLTYCTPYVRPVRRYSRMVAVFAWTAEGPGFESWFGYLSTVDMVQD